ncbi:MAG: hypothetical protein KatS3mg031_1642 [Chitinophagales bacterium]|nr:MAG: hypothetical protein KatS3mg031_1642 [Chitinophagales bacterium]
MAYVKQNNLYGYIDRTGKVMIPLKFENAHSFRQGLASVKIGGKWGFIDTTGTVVIAPKYDYAGSFIDSKADVKLNGKEIKINISDKSLYDSQNTTADNKSKKQDTKPALSEAKEDSLVGDLMKVYFKNDKPLFNKVNALNEYLKTTMIHNGKDYDRSQWPGRSLEIKNNYCKEARKLLTAYETDLKSFESAAGNFDLYIAITAYLKEISRFLSASESWADYIFDKGGENEEIIGMLEPVENSLGAMKLGDELLRGLVTEYQSSKKATGKYLTTMKAAKERNK